MNEKKAVLIKWLQILRLAKEGPSGRGSRWG